MAALPLAICFAGVLTSCDDQLDIVPKGKTTLESVGELELLLNKEYAINVSAYKDLGLICNESYDSYVTIDQLLSQKNTIDYANTTYDESIDRAQLAVEDMRYEDLYQYINYMNVIIAKIDAAKPTEGKSREQIKAEAKAIRAYLHYLLVNIYAKQYDDATAEKEGGIAYVADIDVTKQKVKLSLKETYERILTDCSDEVIAALPDNNPNVERVDKAFGNAVRAKVLMQMKHYAEALPYAQASLKYNGTIEDRSVVKTSAAWTIKENYPGNLLFIRGAIRSNPTDVAASPETYKMFETNDYVIKYAADSWSLMYGEWYLGLKGSAVFAGYGVRQNVYGIVSDRMYFVAAECLIRTGKIKEGLALVDKVREKRVENAVPLAADGLSEEQAMALMQPVKWVECISGYQNFFDCKRWNSEDKYKRTITRDLGASGAFTLSPESKIWVLPFPQNVTRVNPTMTQNY